MPFCRMAIDYPMKAGAASVFYSQRSIDTIPLLGVFGIAMATAVFPLFSTHAVREDWNNLFNNLQQGI